MSSYDMAQKERERAEQKKNFNEYADALGGAGAGAGQALSDTADIAIGAAKLVGGVAKFLFTKSPEQETREEREEFLKAGGEEFEEGEKAEKGGDCQKAIECYEKAVAKGLCRHYLHIFYTPEKAFYRIAKCYHDGLKDSIKALDYYKKAEAYYEIGMFYRYGIENKPFKTNDALAFENFQKAKAERNANAWLELAICYRDGIGTGKDAEAAATHFKTVAHSKDVREDALKHLAEMGISYDVDAEIAKEKKEKEAK